MRYWIRCLFFIAFINGTLWPQAAPPASSTPEPSTQAGAAAATSPAQEPGSSTTVKVKTRLVIVDVVAHDKKGRMVTDLREDDFKVKEDGKQQQISVFAFQRPMALETAGTTQLEGLPPNVFRNAPRFKANSALNVILLDGLNSTLLNQFYVRAEMVKFLEKLPQGQPIAIYALGRKLRLLQDFTTDLTELKRIIQTFKGESSHVHNNPTGTVEVPMTLTGWADQVAKIWAPQLRTQMQDFAQETGSDQMDVRIQYTTAALASLARMLSGYPGRKNLIWITESVPLHMFANIGGITIESSVDSTGHPTRTLPDGQSTVRTQRSYDNQLALIANLFADAQVAVYPIDARGLVGSPFFDPANNVSGQAAMGGLAMQSEGKQAEELFEAHSNMLDIADKTGGKAYYNRNNLDRALLGDIDDGSTYYTLGYYPDNKKWDGRFRKIQVSVGRPDVKVRYRTGYFALDRAVYGKRHPEQRDLDFSQALDPNAPIATALQFEVSVTPPSVQTQNKVVVKYVIDPHQLYFENGADGLRHGQVDCAARIFSAKDVDHPIDTQASRMEAALKPEVFERINRSWFPCQLAIELPAGQYFLRLAVRDNLTGLLGSLNAQVSVSAIAVAKTSSSPK